jgi:30S ribosomal protein S31
MGKGDKKTKKGKIFKGSFGKSRPAKVRKKNAEKKETK